MQNPVANSDSGINEIKILSAFEVDPSLLVEFYQTMYPGRIGFLKDNWSWLNRSSYLNNQIPLVLVLDDKIIAHAGMIPVEVKNREQRYSAGWFIDLAVLPEFQRSGYGSILVRRRMEFTELQITFPNDRSYLIFKKSGWEEPADSYMHYTLISPFNHRRFTKWLPSPLRGFLNSFLFLFMSGIYKKYADRDIDNHLTPLDDVSLNLLLSRYRQSLKESVDYIYPDRDDDFVQWRVLNSPNRDHYYIYNDQEFSALLFLNKKTGCSVDVLWVSDTGKMQEIRKMLCDLAITFRKDGYAYLRFYTTRNELSAYIRKYVRSVVKFRRFVYTSRNKSLIDEIRNSTWNLELIDSDLEHTN